MTRASRMLDYRVKLIMKIESRFGYEGISFEGCSFPIPIRAINEKIYRGKEDNDEIIVESETRFE